MKQQKTTASQCIYVVPSAVAASVLLSSKYDIPPEGFAIYTLLVVLVEVVAVCAPVTVRWVCIETPVINISALLVGISSTCHNAHSKVVDNTPILICLHTYLNGSGGGVFIGHHFCRCCAKCIQYAQRSVIGVAKHTSTQQHI